MSYKFVHRYRQFAPGDLVPETWDWGFVQTMLQARKIEPVVEVKQISEPPADKMVRPERVKTKQR